MLTKRLHVSAPLHRRYDKDSGYDKYHYDGPKVRAQGCCSCKQWQHCITQLQVSTSALSRELL